MDNISKNEEKDYDTEELLNRLQEDLMNEKLINEKLINENKKLEHENKIIVDKYKEIEKSKNDFIIKNAELKLELELDLDSNRKLKEEYENKITLYNEKKNKLELQEKEVKQKEKYLSEELNKNQKKLEELLEREVNVKARECTIAQKELEFEKKKEVDKKEIDKEMIDYRIASIIEIEEERNKGKEKLYKELENIRSVEINRIEKELEIKSNDAQKLIEKRLEELKLEEEKLKQEKQNFEQLKTENEQIKLNNDEEKHKLKVRMQRLEKKEAELEEQEEELDELVEERYKETIKTYREKEKKIEEEMSRIREELGRERDARRSQEMIDVVYKSPELFRSEMESLKQQVETLKEELANRPEKDIEDKYNYVKLEKEQLKSQYNELQIKHNKLQIDTEYLTYIENEKNQLESRYKNLEVHNEVLENRCTQLQIELKRVTSPDGRLSDREERIAEIKTGYLEKVINPDHRNSDEIKSNGEVDEIAWLDKILKGCNDYGIFFPKRILYAFHTALKISDWSTIAVLAGVSGTGKSELPRLYSAFGGLNFINVAVQPNWDSQESMLGFFNSIDNRFDAQPLLKYLVQCTEEEEYNKYMSIVLLDEMNLAHVEYYFAEFLSKLETRRGKTKKSLPSVEIKLGAGIEPYQLKLARNILWVGTMNQDETTKSLSDKVLDRGVVINFPRPRQLSSRKNMESIESAIKNSNRSMLRNEVWGNWVERSIKLEESQMEELNRYKKITEEINNALDIVGRALGHRVWQSIEYYIVNYPLVRKAIKESNKELTGELKKAMKMSFEDQIVQKIMPKLRGIETRGRGRESLDKIEALLENNGFEKLKDDFTIAREQGYGQFIWNSAKYIENEEFIISEEIVIENVEEKLSSDIEG